MERKNFTTLHAMNETEEFDPWPMNGNHRDPIVDTHRRYENDYHPIFGNPQISEMNGVGAPAYNYSVPGNHWNQSRAHSIPNTAFNQSHAMSGDQFHSQNRINTTYPHGWIPQYKGVEYQMPHHVTPFPVTRPKKLDKWKPGFCIDNPNYFSFRGRGCSFWKNKNCRRGSAILYMRDDGRLNRLEMNCPYTCQTEFRPCRTITEQILSGITSCEDDYNFQDKYGKNCDNWIGRDCNNLINNYPNPYTPDEMVEVQWACKNTCKGCYIDSKLICLNDDSYRFRGQYACYDFRKEDRENGLLLRKLSLEEVFEVILSCAQTFEMCDGSYIPNLAPPLTGIECIDFAGIGCQKKQNLCIDEDFGSFMKEFCPKTCQMCMPRNPIQREAGCRPDWIDQQGRNCEYYADHDLCPRRFKNGYQGPWVCPICGCTDPKLAKFIVVMGIIVPMNQFHEHEYTLARIMERYLDLDSGFVTEKVKMIEDGHEIFQRPSRIFNISDYEYKEHLELTIEEVTMIIYYSVKFQLAQAQIRSRLADPRFLPFILEQYQSRAQDRKRIRGMAVLSYDPNFSGELNNLQYHKASPACVSRRSSNSFGTSWVCETPGYAECRESTLLQPCASVHTRSSGRECLCVQLPFCPKNSYVRNGTCAKCPIGTSRPPGDFIVDGNTVCTPGMCKINEYVYQHSCRQCADGYENTHFQGAPNPMDGPDTFCHMIPTHELRFSISVVLRKGSFSLQGYPEERLKRAISKMLCLCMTSIEIERTTRKRTAHRVSFLQKDVQSAENQNKIEDRASKFGKKSSRFWWRRPSHYQRRRSLESRNQEQSSRFSREEQSYQSSRPQKSYARREEQLYQPPTPQRSYARREEQLYQSPTPQRSYARREEQLYQSPTPQRSYARREEQLYQSPTPQRSYAHSKESSLQESYKERFFPISEYPSLKSLNQTSYRERPLPKRIGSQFRLRPFPKQYASYLRTKSYQNPQRSLLLPGHIGHIENLIITLFNTQQDPWDYHKVKSEIERPDFMERLVKGLYCEKCHVIRAIRLLTVEDQVMEQKCNFDVFPITGCGQKFERCMRSDLQTKSRSPHEGNACIYRLFCDKTEYVENNMCRTCKDSNEIGGENQSIVGQDTQCIRKDLFRLYERQQLDNYQVCENLQCHKCHYDRLNDKAEKPLWHPHPIASNDVPIQSPDYGYKTYQDYGSRQSQNAKALHDVLPAEDPTASNPQPSDSTHHTQSHTSQPSSEHHDTHTSKHAASVHHHTHTSQHAASAHRTQSHTSQRAASAHRTQSHTSQRATSAHRTQSHTSQRAASAEYRFHKHKQPHPGENKYSVDSMDQFGSPVHLVKNIKEFSHQYPVDSINQNGSPAHLVKNITKFSRQPPQDEHGFTMMINTTKITEDDNRQINPNLEQDFIDTEDDNRRNDQIIEQDFIDTEDDNRQNDQVIKQDFTNTIPMGAHLTESAPQSYRYVSDNTTASSVYHIDSFDDDNNTSSIGRESIGKDIYNFDNDDTSSIGTESTNINNFDNDIESFDSTESTNIDNFDNDDTSSIGTESTNIDNDIESFDQDRLNFLDDTFSSE